MLHRRGLMAGFAALAAHGIARSSYASTPGQILFQQPVYNNGIGPNFSVTGVVPQYNPIGAFYLHANQPNPFRPDHNFTPVTWDVGTMTGLSVDPGSSGIWQRGIWVPSLGTGRQQTAAQVYGGAVGGYLNSANLINGAPDNRMMISPNYYFPATPNQITPFASATSVLGIALDLQVPTATDLNINQMSNTYVKIDLLFVCATTGGRVSVSCGLFSHNGNPKGDGTGYDNLTNTAIMDALVSPLGKLVSLQPGSTQFLNQPWRNWKNFSFTMSQKQFLSGLRSVQPIAKSYGITLSTDPTEYVLTSTHLNAELHFTTTTPATLGWSMQNLAITQVA